MVFLVMFVQLILVDLIIALSAPHQKSGAVDRVEVVRRDGDRIVACGSDFSIFHVYPVYVLGYYRKQIFKIQDQR
jgi:hypothetical protein